MKKIVFSVLLVSTLSAFSQSEYQYKAKFDGANDATKAAPIIQAMKTVFKTDATFNESTNEINFNSKMSISPTVFNNMMSDEGFTVESFEKHETEVAETKPTGSDKKEVPFKEESANLQTQAVKKPK